MQKNLLPVQMILWILMMVISTTLSIAIIQQVEQRTTQLRIESLVK
ncbi:hypothetical protein [Chamaesiphon sp.]